MRHGTVKHDGDLMFQGRRMRNIVIETPPLALARFLSRELGRQAKALRAQADDIPKRPSVITNQ